MTYKETCEAIASFLTEKDPAKPVTWQQVWEMSPSGEIWPIHALYEDCVARGMPDVAASLHTEDTEP